MTNEFIKSESEIEDAEIIPQFSDVKSWDELSQRLSSLNLTNSSGELVTAEGLQAGVDRARESRFVILTEITRTEGLREAVARLLIPEAADLEELSRLLQHIKTLPGSSELFSQDRLRELIQRVIDGDHPELLTSSFELRQTVLRIKESLKQ